MQTQVIDFAWVFWFVAIQERVFFAPLSNRGLKFFTKVLGSAGTHDGDLSDNAGYEAAVQ
jgi:hypothetical protein